MPVEHCAPMWLAVMVKKQLQQNLPKKVYDNDTAVSNLDGYVGSIRESEPVVGLHLFL